jgi:hypothetical protein
MLERSGDSFLLRAQAFAAVIVASGALAAQAQSTGGGMTVIKGNSQTLTQTIKGGSVRITGDANTITLKGKVKALHVGGDENGVRVEEVQSIMTKGDGNLVKWKKAMPPAQSPQIKNSGDHNTVEKDDGGSLTTLKNSAMDKKTD